MQRLGITSGVPTPRTTPESDYYNTMENRSVFDQFSKGFADAIADIREKVVEEPMYGRALTNHHNGAGG
jgi:hypothetical protein